MQIKLIVKLGLIKKKNIFSENAWINALIIIIIESLLVMWNLLDDKVLCV